jgi:DNA-binding transcriptional LysR family regulator
VLRNNKKTGKSDHMKTKRDLSVRHSDRFSRLRLGHLSLLVALSEEHGVHRVARRLGMTQPGASKLLREAENAFGLTLFERTRRGATPNRYGAMVVERARLVMGLLDATRSDLASVAQGLAGTISVGTFAVAAPLLVPRAVLRLHARGSKVHVRLEEGSPEALLILLQRGHLDCVVGRISASDSTSKLSIERLWDEPIIVAVGPNHPLLGRRRVRWQDTVGFDWVLPPAVAPMRRAVETWFARRRLDMPRSLIESVSLVANLTIARESQTLVMLPGTVAHHYASLDLIRVLPLRLESTPVAVAMRAEERPTEVLQSFLGAMREVAVELTRRQSAAASV